jgi:phosphoglycolate phosphatase-like HAD superfamily hydrolase
MLSRGHAATGPSAGERPTKLAVFDVDGTLTDTADVDSACFAEAITEAFGIREFERDWTAYSDFTDSIILDELFGEHFGRSPRAEEIERLIDTFVAILGRAHGRRPEAFEPIAGAPELVARLRARSDWDIAVATGGWGRSARLKLGYAGIDLAGGALGSANDARSRAEIVAGAIRRGEERARTSFDRAVLVGDTVWDVRTATRLGRPFLGVGGPARAEALREAGALAVVADFVDLESVLDHLESVEAPQAR